eukprot:644632-Pleurochrysis_carterae.AAC.2
MLPQRSVAVDAAVAVAVAAVALDFEGEEEGLAGATRHIATQVQVRASGVRTKRDPKKRAHPFHRARRDFGYVVAVLRAWVERVWREVLEPEMQPAEARRPV